MRSLDNIFIVYTILASTIKKIDMLKNLTLFLLMIASSVSYSQMIPNGDFEGPPFEWKGSSGGSTSIGGIAIVPKAGGGNDTILPFEGNGMGKLSSTSTSGSLSQTFAFSGRPDTYRFMYNYIPKGDDVGRAILILTKYNSGNSSRDTLIHDSLDIDTAFYPDWKEAVMDLRSRYKMSGDADTGFVQFISSATEDINENTTLTLDNIRFAAFSSSVDELTIELISSPQILPNPVAGNATLNYELRRPSDATIQIMDINGKTLITLNRDNLFSGSHSEDIDTRELANGIYICNIKAGSSMARTKFVVSK
jgi:hypothetical protein